MEEKQFITISRKWNKPHIITSISTEGIAISINMDDFRIALKSEMGSVAWVFTKAEFEKRLDAAIESILKGIKQESIKVMTKK